MRAPNYAELYAMTADFRFLWGCIPADCKQSLRRIKTAGLWDQARPVILTEAEAGLKLLGKHTLMDVCVALELAAEHWLADYEHERAKVPLCLPSGVEVFCPILKRPEGEVAP